MSHQHEWHGPRVACSIGGLALFGGGCSLIGAAVQVGWLCVGAGGAVFLFSLWSDRWREPTEGGPPNPPPAANATLIAPPTAPFQAVVPSKQLPAELTAGRIILPHSVTPEWLWEQFVGRTDIQAQGLVKGYLGKWMKISGRLGDFGSSSSTTHMLTFEHGRFESVHNVYMYYSAPLFIDRLAVMPLGEHIDVLGLVYTIDSLIIRLKDCELV